MTDLSPQLEQLVMAGRIASRPTEADFERVLGALQARIGTGPIAGELPLASKGPNLTRAVSSKVVAIATAGIALTMGGVALYRLQPQQRAAEPRPAPVATAPVAVRAPSVPSVVSEEPVSAAQSSGLDSTQVKSAAPSAREPNRNRDSLSEEVAILSRAETELHSGRAEAALKTLNEHEKKFPRGILAEERVAARIQALCALGRATEANALLARLRPGSLHGESSRQACATKNVNR